MECLLYYDSFSTKSNIFGQGQETTRVDPTLGQLLAWATNIRQATMYLSLKTL